SWRSTAPRPRMLHWRIPFGGSLYPVIAARSCAKIMRSPAPNWVLRPASAAHGNCHTGWAASRAQHRGAAPGRSTRSPGMTYDLLIKHGTIIDGTGAPGVVADIGVSSGRITALAPQLEGSAARQIDASGRIVAPGFIDVHTHSDFTLLSAPSADSKVRQ